MNSELPAHALFISLFPFLLAIVCTITLLLLPLSIFDAIPYQRSSSGMLRGAVDPSGSRFVPGLCEADFYLRCNPVFCLRRNPLATIFHSFSRVRKARLQHIFEIQFLPGHQIDWLPIKRISRNICPIKTVRWLVSAAPLVCSMISSMQQESH